MTAYLHYSSSYAFMGYAECKNILNRRLASDLFPDSRSPIGRVQKAVLCGVCQYNLQPGATSRLNEKPPHNAEIP